MINKVNQKNIIHNLYLMWTQSIRQPIARRILSTSCNRITYSRKHFEDLNIDYEAIKRAEDQKARQELTSAITNLKNNDRNPNNFIKKLKVNSEAHDVFKNFQKNYTAKQCCILTPEPVKPRVFISAKRKYIITSIKKAKLALFALKKLYLHDAILYCQGSPKKVARLILPTLFNLIRHAIDREMDPFRLFIHGILIGKTMRYKGIRYHAKGRGGREKKDICQVKVVLYEKDEQDFWKDIGTGKVPPAFAAYVRQRLVEIKANHQKILQYTGITTAKGRQQKREILKRKVSMQMIKNKRQGTYVPKKTIEKQMNEEEGEKARQLFLNLKAESQMPSLKRRQILFKANENL